MPDEIGIPEADRAQGCAHPRETYDLIGHQGIEAKIARILQSGRLHHAWLLTGPTGVGKATLAYRMIRMIFGGQSPFPDTLDISRSDPVAQRVESLGHGDLFVLRRPYDHKRKTLLTEITIGEARRMTEFFSRKPAEGGWRVCLIDSMDDMNRNSENAILKSLEEPPDKTILILLSAYPGRLLPTIRSRCLHLPLRPVSLSDIQDWLNCHDDVSADMSAWISALSQGSPGRAKALLQAFDPVITSLQTFIASLEGADRRIDAKLADAFSSTQTRTHRALFWDGLRDILRLNILHAKGQPMPIDMAQMTFNARALSGAISQWERLDHLKNREEALNMDKRVVMLEALSSMRDM